MNIGYILILVSILVVLHDLCVYSYDVMNSSQIYILLPVCPWIKSRIEIPLNPTSDRPITFTPNYNSSYDQEVGYRRPLANITRLFKHIHPSVAEDARLKVPELIQKYGYPCDVHIVTSPDGYILEMHRIPHGREGPTKNRPAVYLQHGLLSSSADWLVTGPDKALGYILADAGYDVWISNVRGNRYSRKHVFWDPVADAAKFWDFSWHEIALLDVPTLIDYVLAQTNQPQVNYIGHSQGTTVFYILCSEKPEYNKKIRVHFSLAPVGFMKSMGSPFLRFIAFFEGSLDALFNLIGIYEFLPNTGLLAILGDLLCKDNSAFQLLCTNTLFILAGFNSKQMNATLLPILMGHTPAGAAPKQIIHYGQEVRSGKFGKFDYGFFGNLKRYGSITPPNYDLQNIKAPMYLFYSRNDWMSGERDVLKLYKKTHSVLEKFLLPDPLFAHFDYLYGISANDLVYRRIISLMKMH